MFIKTKRLSISKKLTIIYSSILLSILLIFTILTFFSIRNIIINDSETIISSNADVIINYVSSIQNINKINFNNISLAQGVYYTVYDENENIIYSNSQTKTTLKGPHQKTKGLGSGNNFEHNNGIIFTNRTVNINGKKYSILLTKDFEDIGAKLDTMIGLLIFTSILGTIVCFISGSFLSKKLLEPIKDITRTAKEITSKSLSKRIVTNGAKDELKDLADTFNLMIERLETDFENQKRFVSDASHELRTPLSVIHGHVNMLNRWGKNNPDQLSKSLKTLKTEAENMNTLIENLLYLARGDNDVLIIKKEEFQLFLLIKEVAGETLLNHNKIKISYICEEKVIIYTDYNALKQVLRILADNSVKFSKDFGEIKIIAKEKEEGVLITVIDNGIGIPLENIPYIFDRFYRVDESRTKTTGGTGLGLAIAKQIVESDKGIISAESELDKGTKISIFIPKSKIYN